jgi:ectoine hydroxylase-related dioxygenase (phytanoyl-CoA dioxygenase family)
MKCLSRTQVDAYRRDGFLFPLPMLGAAERDEKLAALARYEAWLGGPLSKAERQWFTMPYLFLPWFDALVRDQRILDVVEDLIGPDILVWTSTFWIKEPGSPTFAAWHQDCAYFGLEPPEIATVWLALTDASSLAGCMNAIPWQGRPRLYRHGARRHADSINRGGQSVLEPLDEAKAVAMALPAGSFSLHHGLCLHRSAPNRAAHRRIGLGFNYMPTHVRSIGSVRLSAMLVRGQDRFGHFDLIEPLARELDETGLRRHAEAYARYGENYREQIARHEAEFRTA